jgi:GT2 family glycosyltransferase
MLEGTEKLAIIIVEFDSPEDTVRCLDTIEEYLGSDTKLYIYDNSSQEHKILGDKLKTLSVAYEYFWNGGNLGFAKACNLGLTKVKEDGFAYAMLLNNDTLLIDDSPLLALEIFGRYPDIAVLGLVNYYVHNPSEVWQAGKRLRKSKLGFFPVAATSGTEITFCDYVAGSSFIVRLSILESIGLLDEEYFAYYEEIDYCFRVKSSGMKVAYINDSKILHKVGASSDSAVKTYLKSRNKLYFYRSILHSRLSFVVVVSLLLAKDLLLRLLRGGSLETIKYTCLGIKDFRSRNMKLTRFS